MTDPFENRLRGQLVAGRPRFVRRRRNRLVALAASATMVVVGVVAVAVLNRPQEPVQVLSVAPPSPGTEGGPTGPTQAAPPSGDSLVSFPYSGFEPISSSVRSGGIAFAGTVDRIRVYAGDLSKPPEYVPAPDEFGVQVAWVTVTASYRGGLKVGLVVPVQFGFRNPPGPSAVIEEEAQVGQSYIFLVGSTGTDSRIPDVDLLYQPLTFNGVGVIAGKVQPEPESAAAPLKIRLADLIAMIDKAAVESPNLDPAVESAARANIDEVVSLVRDHVISATAGYFSEGGVFFNNLSPSEAVERFRTDNPWLSTSTSLKTSITPSFALTQPNPVVTVVGRSADDKVQGATALVLGSDPDSNGSLSIVRLDTPPEVRPSIGSTVRPGDVITISTVPVEGGATARIGDTELQINADQKANKTWVKIPELAHGDIVLTMSFATPEEPTAFAIWFRVVG